MDIFNEKTTGYVNLSFKDEDGSAVTPDSATYTLYNEDTDAIINGRSTISITALASSLDLEIEDADNVIVDTNKIREIHVLLVEWVYNSSKKGKSEYRFAVENLLKVT